MACICVLLLLLMSCTYAMPTLSKITTSLQDHLDQSGALPNQPLTPRAAVNSDILSYRDISLNPDSASEEDTTLSQRSIPLQPVRFPSNDDDVDSQSDEGSEGIPVTTFTHHSNLDGSGDPNGKPLIYSARGRVVREASFNFFLPKSMPHLSISAVEPESPPALDLSSEWFQHVQNHAHAVAPNSQDSRDEFKDKEVTDKEEQPAKSEEQKPHSRSRWQRFKNLFCYKKFTIDQCKLSFDRFKEKIKSWLHRLRWGVRKQKTEPEPAQTFKEQVLQSHAPKPKKDLSLLKTQLRNLMPNSNEHDSPEPATPVYSPVTSRLQTPPSLPQNGIAYSPMCAIRPRGFAPCESSPDLESSPNSVNSRETREYNRPVVRRELFGTPTTSETYSSFGLRSPSDSGHLPVPPAFGNKIEEHRGSFQATRSQSIGSPISNSMFKLTDM